MDLSGYLAVAKRWWWTLIVAAWIAGLTGYLVATTIQPTYEAQVKVLVGPLNTDTDTLRASGLLVQTYAQYVTTREVLASTIQELGLDLEPDDLAAATRATANDVTRILTIQVQADDPQQASDLANTVATELEQLTSRGLSRPEGLVQIIEFAQPSPEPVAPQVSLIAHPCRARRRHRRHRARPAPGVLRRHGPNRQGTRHAGDERRSSGRSSHRLAIRPAPPTSSPWSPRNPGRRRSTG